jgi:hypothetical protein
LETKDVRRMAELFHQGDYRKKVRTRKAVLGVSSDENVKCNFESNVGKRQQTRLS